MRKRDIKGIDVDNGTSEPNGVQDSNSDKGAPISEGTHDQINLITVDTQRLTDFLSYNSMLATCFPSRALLG